MPTWPGRRRWTSAYQLRLGAQAMYQSGVGEQLLTGSSFSTWSGGLKADLMSGGATATLAYQQTGSGSTYQTPYSGWAGYTYMIVKSFNQAGQKAWLLGGNYDFAAHEPAGAGAQRGHRLRLGRDQRVHRRGTAELDRIRPDAGLPLQRRSSWPEWARPFWIRGRAAYVDMRSDGDIQDYRIIVNYEWKF